MEIGVCWLDFRAVTTAHLSANSAETNHCSTLLASYLILGARHSTSGVWLVDYMFLQEGGAHAQC